MTAKKTTQDPNTPTPEKIRKPRASSVAVTFAKRIETAAGAKIDAEAQMLSENVFKAATDAAESLLGRPATADETFSLLTIAIGEQVGVSKIGVAAARNVLQPALTETMLAGVGA